MYFHQTELFYGFQSGNQHHANQCLLQRNCEILVGVTIYLCKNLLLRFKEQIRIIDTPELHEKTAF